MDNNDNKRDNQEEILWHFTSTHSLQLILEKGLLATHSADLKDGTESLLKNRLLATITHIAENTTKIFDKVSPEDIQSTKNGIERGEFYPTYTTSFSETPWFPYMWEHYTPNGGFAIGLSKESITALTNREEMTSGQAVRFDSCNYGMFQKESEHVARLRNGFEVVSAKLKEKHPSKKQSLLVKAILKNAFPLVFVKQAFFAAENECRLVHILGCHPNNVVMINGKRRIYVNPKGQPKDYVRRILVSPKGDQGCNHAIAQIVAKMFGIPEVRIEAFRNTEFADQPEILASNGR